MTENYPNLDEPSEALKQEFATLILDNTPDQTEGSEIFNHPDGRNFALVRPTILATDPRYESEGQLVQFDRSYIVFVYTPTVGDDGKNTGENESSYKYDPLSGEVIKDITIEGNGIFTIIRDVRLKKEMKDKDDHPSVDGDEFQKLVDDIKVAIAHKPAN